MFFNETGSDGTWWLLPRDEILNGDHAFEKGWCLPKIIDQIVYYQYQKSFCKTIVYVNNCVFF